MKTKGSRLLKEFRFKESMTQEDLARNLKIAKSTIAMIEADENYKTSVTTAKAIATYCGFDWATFFEVDNKD